MASVNSFKSTLAASTLPASTPPSAPHEVVSSASTTVTEATMARDPPKSLISVHTPRGLGPILEVAGGILNDCRLPPRRPSPPRHAGPAAAEAEVGYGHRETVGRSSEKSCRGSPRQADRRRRADQELGRWWYFTSSSAGSCLVEPGPRPRPEAINVACPEAIVQTCVVHLVRNSVPYSSRPH